MRRSTGSLFLQCTASSMLAGPMLSNYQEILRNKGKAIIEEYPVSHELECRQC